MTLGLGKDQNDVGQHDQHQLGHSAGVASAKSSQVDSASESRVPSAEDNTRAQQMTDEWVDGTPEEKRLLRKLDWRILPCTWILYLFSYLDRTNISNAKTAGLQDSFGFTDAQYSIIVLLFFVAFIIFEVPANMILTRIRPSLFFPGLGLTWGIFATLAGSTANWTQIAGVRFLLGFAEAGFPPGCAFYFSCWYRQYELATRFALLYTAVPFSGAISGLLAGVITGHMDGLCGLAGWRWLFILNGLMSIAAAIVTYFLVPDYPSSSKRFLNQEESALACKRLTIDGIDLAQSAGAEPLSHWKALKMACCDWRVWAQCFMLTLVTGSQMMQYFIPTLVKSFGWKGAVGQSYATAIIYVVVSCRLADKYKRKWEVTCALSGLGCVLFIAVTTAQSKVAQYVLTVFAFGTIYGCSPLVKTWISDVIPRPAGKRAVAIALVNAVGNASSLYSTWLWPDKDAPRYIPGFATTTTWLGVFCVSTVIFAYLFRKYPIPKLDQTEVFAAQLRAQREEEQTAENKA